MNIENLSLEHLKQVIEVVKPMRPNVMRLFKNHVYSSDLNNSHHKSMQFDLDIHPTLQNKLLSFNQLVKFVKDIQKYEVENDKTVGDTITFYNRWFTHQEVPGPYIEEIDPVFYSNPLSVLSSKRRIDYPDIMEDPNFVDCLTAKSAEGLKVYIKDGFYMTMFTGLIPALRSDKVELSIFDHVDGTFHALFLVNKKKIKYPINILIRYRNPR